MNLSGILVVVRPERLADAVEELNALPGVQVHHTDPPTGRIVITQEAGSIDTEVEGLKAGIQSLPHVILAEMVQHHFEDDGEILESATKRDSGKGPDPVPPFLKE